jgi:hypothetical protein
VKYEHVGKLPCHIVARASNDDFLQRETPKREAQHQTAPWTTQFSLTIQIQQPAFRFISRSASRPGQPPDLSMMANENDQNKDEHNPTTSVPAEQICPREDSSSLGEVEVDVDDVSLSKLRAANATANRTDAAVQQQEAARKPPRSPPRPTAAPSGSAAAPPKNGNAGNTGAEDGPNMKKAGVGASEEPLELDHVMLPVLNDAPAGETEGPGPNHAAKTPKATNHHHHRRYANPRGDPRTVRLR